MRDQHKTIRRPNSEARIYVRTRRSQKEKNTMLKRILGITSLLLLPLAAGAATLIIPAAGTGPGANGSQWSSDFIIHNASAQPASIDLVWHDSNGAGKPQSFFIGPHTTVTSRDVVRGVFGITSGTGAIEVDVDDGAASHLAITSR